MAGCPYLARDWRCNDRPPAIADFQLTGPAQTRSKGRLRLCLDQDGTLAGGMKGEWRRVAIGVSRKEIEVQPSGCRGGGENSFDQYADLECALDKANQITAPVQ